MRFVIIIGLGLLGTFLISGFNGLQGTNNLCNSNQCEKLSTDDPNLKLELVYQGISKFESNSLSPVSSMTFLGLNDILLLDKNNGTVYRIQNGTSSHAILDVNVANERERGLLGIATSYGSNNKTYVYVYYTEANGTDGSDNCPKKWYSDAHHCIPEKEPLGNRLYKYELKDNTLINPRLILDLPSSPSPTHNGGVIKIGPDKNLYVIVGDMLGGTDMNSSTMAQNYNITAPDGRAGILRITQNGESVGKGILGSSMPLKLYYAYGIRNGFGLSFDPMTGNLWDTENGPEYGDEINLVKPGFNSGWEGVQGKWIPVENTEFDSDLIAGNEIVDPDNTLVNFNGTGKYSKPKFTWNQTVGPTAIQFLDSDKLGRQYQNDLFVASYHLGTIFHFDLLKDRSGLNLQGILADGIADKRSEMKNITFASGLGGITDMDVGPDGYLYILSNYGSKPTIFRIIPSSDSG